MHFVVELLCDVDHGLGGVDGVAEHLNQVGGGELGPEGALGGLTLGDVLVDPLGPQGVVDVGEHVLLYQLLVMQEQRFRHQKFQNFFPFDFQV